MYVVLGNSGSGKTTLARRLADRLNLDPVDLDKVYWEPDEPGVARPEHVAKRELLRRLGERESWIVEGCYESLAEHLLVRRPLLIWLDPGEPACLAHCRARPWEPHKYPSKEAQDENLTMLLGWVSDHYQRSGPMSYRAHRALFEHYPGPKTHQRTTAVSVEALLTLARTHEVPKT